MNAYRFTADIVERVILLRVEAFDWNCPQHITPRYTMEELQDVLVPVREKLTRLEAENVALRKTLSLTKKEPSDSPPNPPAIGASNPI